MNHLLTALCLCLALTAQASANSVGSKAKPAATKAKPTATTAEARPTATAAPSAALTVTESATADAFPIVSKRAAARILYDGSDYEVVKECASLLAGDIRSVSGRKPKLIQTANLATSHPSIIVGTVGHSALIDKLISDGRLDVFPILGGWEQYIIQTIDSDLVIAGCDRRGTAYGIFALSEAIGVDPLYWWADVPAKQHKTLYLAAGRLVSKAPSVRYRGIFINDEGWGMQPWASKTYEPEVGNMGPKTYARICELILRMKGNMLAPAMHPNTVAFNRIDGNREVADKYGIVMTSSHCEPLLYNNTTEWDKAVNGEWNYLTNKDGILKVLDERSKQTAPFENVYVLAMRGIHDAGLVGVPEDRKAEVTEAALGDEREIISRRTGKPATELPQVFVPYKEVLDIYMNGMHLPDDVTLVWPDDNFGYIKKLSDDKEQKRSGASGVYYHISYLGGPHDYLWLNTTPPALIYEEMKKAYDTGADRYWLLNVGDIKPGELGMKFFLDLAWDINSAGYDSAHLAVPAYLSGIFGEQYRAELQDIMDTYYRLGFQRKPEAMGWGMEWNTSVSHERVVNTDFSFVSYSEAESRLAEYDRISAAGERIFNALPDSYKAAFYELVLYPVRGATLMNRKMLAAQQNRWYAIQGRAATARSAETATSCHDSIGVYTARYNSMLDGKWNHIMALAPGWVATYQNLPPLSETALRSGADMQIFIPGKVTEYGLNVLPCLNPYTRRDSFIELYNRGSEPFTWQASASEPWVKLRLSSGETFLQDRIPLSLDWAEVPKGKRITAEITITSGDRTETVYLPVFNPASPSADELRGLYVEDNACISISPARFHRKVENSDIAIRTIPGLGYEGECLQLGEATRPSQGTWDIDRTPKAEYDFYCFSSGTVTVNVYTLPTFPVNSKRDCRYGVMIDDGVVQTVSAASKEYSGEWTKNVARNCAVGTVNLNIATPGRHTLKLICLDPGVVLQKAVIDFGGQQRSYLGPPVSLAE